MSAWRRLNPQARAAVVIVGVTVVAAVAISAAVDRGGARPPLPPHPAIPASTAAAPTTTATSSSGASLLPPPGADATGQTTDQPVTATATFAAEMQALWSSIVTGNAGAALDTFFPASAYLQLKALSDDAADYEGRLVAHFELDIGAAHELLGADAATAQFVSVVTPPTTPTWIPPGGCANRLGYWHLPGSRLVYREDGIVRSIGIASLISWRGYWYVVHLGSVEPPAAQGVVDAPATGTGTFTPTGGC